MKCPECGGTRRFKWKFSTLLEFDGVAIADEIDGIVRIRAPDLDLEHDDGNLVQCVVCGHSEERFMFHEENQGERP